MDFIIAASHPCSYLTTSSNSQHESECWVTNDFHHCYKVSLISSGTWFPRNISMKVTSWLQMDFIAAAWFFFSHLEPVFFEISTQNWPLRYKWFSTLLQSFFVPIWHLISSKSQHKTDFRFTNGFHRCCKISLFSSGTCFVRNLNRKPTSALEMVRTTVAKFLFSFGRWFPRYLNAKPTSALQMIFIAVATYCCSHLKHDWLQISQKWFFGYK